MSGIAPTGGCLLSLMSSALTCSGAIEPLRQCCGHRE